MSVLTSIDPSIIEQIQNDGVIENNGLWRRWITAQTYKCYTYGPRWYNYSNAPSTYNKSDIQPQKQMDAEHFEGEYNRKFFLERDMKYAIQSLAREIKIQRKSTIFPDLVTLNDVIKFLNAYKKSIVNMINVKPSTGELSDTVVQQLNLSSSKIRTNLITCNRSWYDPFDNNNCWYRAQYELLKRLELTLYGGYGKDLPTWSIPTLTREYTFKKLKYRMCDMAVIMSDNRTTLEHMIDRIIKSIKSLDDFVELAESSIINILPLSATLNTSHTDMTDYKDVFKRIGAYYTLQNMIMFHHFDGLTMDELNKTAKDTPDLLWDTLKQQIDENHLMDYLVPTQIDEC